MNFQESKASAERGNTDAVTKLRKRVGALGATITLTPALLTFAAILTATAGLVAAPNRRAPHSANEDPSA